MTSRQKIAIIIGAGPAGLTAAYELLQQSDIKPVILEMTTDIGGIAKTINHKGNRIDIGGHRFFSKSDKVMDWWRQIMAVEEETGPQSSETSDRLLVPDKQNQRQNSMLVRRRLSRIYFLRRFFDYPLTLNSSTFKNLGIIRMVRITFSYLKAKLIPIKGEKNLEDFFTNRFGTELYKIFFKSYTEKIWGVPCDRIKPEWGAQRVKGLSITRAILHALKNLFKRDPSVAQKNTETSLIERFIYPKYGPGQMWQEVAKRIQQNGGELHLNQRVVGLYHHSGTITSITVHDEQSGTTQEYRGDFFISTMPIKDLIQGFDRVPENIANIAQGLLYRDFITIGLLLNKLKIKNTTKIKTRNDLVPDNWIYIQEPLVKIGRLQIFNNWSPYMVADPDKVWVGLEYFCTEGDELWNRDDTDIAALGIKELTEIGMIDPEDVLDQVVIRMPKAYPAYFGTYDQIPIIRDYLNSFHNLSLIGRNGQHRYNNQDHSMLTAMEAVHNIVHDIKDKDNIWDVNTDQDYHETK